MTEQNLLERDVLLSTLMELLDAADSGTGQLVLIGGEAGAGKTSLVRALVDQLPESVLVLIGACDPLTTPRPLSPLLDFAADSDSGLEDLLIKSENSIEVFNTVLRRLSHTIRPILMIVEDIHWADQGTLDFVRFVGRRVGETRSVVICTYREDEVGPAHPTREVLGQLIPLPSTRRLLVPPLTVDAVSTLTEGTNLDPGRLHQVTGGNAFYVTEVIAGGERLPLTVQDAVVARVSHLDDGARKVVEAVSIAPRSLELDRVLLLTGGTPGDVDAAVAAGTILGDGRTLRFRHELARAAVEASLLPAWRLGLHRKMIELLLDDDIPDFASLAHHAISAEDGGLIVKFSPAAALEALERGAHKEAASFYGAVVEHPDLIDGDKLAQLRVALSGELGLIGSVEPSVAQAQLAVNHWRQGGQPKDLARALEALASAQWRLTDRESARATADEAVELLRPLESSPEKADAFYQSSYLHMLARRAQPAESDISEAMRIAEETGSQAALWRVRMVKSCIAIVMGQVQEGLSGLADLLSEAYKDNDPVNVAAALSMLGSGGGEARSYSKAVEALERTVEHGTKFDFDYQVAYGQAWLARIAFEQGRWDDAVSYAEVVTQLPPPTSHSIATVTAAGALGRVRVRRGDPGAVGMLQQALASEQQHEIQHVWSPLCGLAELHWLSSEFEEMQTVLEDGLRRALETDSQWARGELGFWMWKAGGIDQPPDNAAVPFSLQMSGDWRGAADAWQQIGCPYEVALALADGDQEAKLEALSILDGIGARPMANMVRSQLRKLGVEGVPRGPRRETSANPAGLTGRQLEVLKLMVSGMSNSEMAEELFLSKKTIEHHVSAIFSRLGVVSRPKAIARAREIGAVDGGLETAR